MVHPALELGFDAYRKKKCPEKNNFFFFFSSFGTGATDTIDLRSDGELGSW